MEKKLVHLMPTCLVIRGRSHTGKSFASVKFEEEFQALCIHYDVILELICECTRLFFENRKDEKPIVSVKKPLTNEEDLENFKNELYELISENFDYFRFLYETKIKDTISRGQLREKGLNIHDLNIKLYRPESVAKYLEKKIDKVFGLMIKNFIKDWNFFIIEGVYFLDEFYLKQLKKFCNELIILDCSCVPAIGVESYNYRNKKYPSLEKLHQVMNNDLKEFKKRD